MSFTSVTLTGTIEQSPGTVAPGAAVSMLLSNVITDGTIDLSPKTVSARANNSGVFSITVPANDDSTTEPAGTYYKVIITYSDQVLDQFKVVVPNADAPTVGLFSLPRINAGTQPNITYGVTSLQLADSTLTNIGTPLAPVLKVTPGLYEATVGLANGTSDAAAFNTALAAAGSAGRGTVRGLPGQNYVLEQPVTIPANVTLDLSGCKVTRKTSYVGQGNYLIQNSAVIPERSVNDAVVAGTALTSSLTAGLAYTSLAISALPVALPSGALVTLITPVTGSFIQTWTLSAPANANATSLSVVSQICTGTGFAIGTTVVSNLLTSATAAFTSQDVGRAVTLVGAGRFLTSPSEETVTNLYTTILSVTNSTTVLLTEAAVVAVSAATLDLYGRDSNVGLIGNASTTIDNGSVSGNPKPVVFRRIDNLSIKLGGATCAGGGAGNTFINPGDVTNCVIDDILFNTGMGGVQVYGPATATTITNIRGACGDDFVAVQGSAFGWDQFDGNDCQGSISELIVGSIFPTNTLAEGVKFFGGLDNAGVNCDFHGVVVEKVYGSGASSGVVVLSDRGGTTTIGNFVVRDVRYTAGAGHSPISLDSSGIRDITIENVGWDGRSGVSGTPLYAVNCAGCGIDKLTFRGFSLELGETYVTAVNVTSAIIWTAVIDDVDFRNNTNCDLIDIAVDSEIRSALEISNVTMPSAGSVVNCAGHINGELRLQGVTASNQVTAIILSSSTQSAVTTARLSQVNFRGGSYALMTSVQTVVYVSQCTFGSSITTSPFNVATTGTLRVISTGCQWSAGGNAPFSTTVPFSATGDVQLDITAAELTPQNGDTVYATLATLATGIGPAIYNSSAGIWSSIYQTPVFTPINPGTLGSLVGWYKADAITGLTDGQSVSSWLDSSSSNIPLVQATGANQPTYKTGIQNSLPVVRFNGTSDILTAGSSIAGVQQVIVVAKFNGSTFSGTSQFAGLVGGKNGVAGDLILAGINSGGGTNFQDLTSAGDNFTSYYKDGTPHIPSQMAAPMNAFASMAIASTTITNPLFVQVGNDRTLANRYWNGDVCEVIVLNAILGITQLAGVLAYLQQKWATPALPV